MRFATQNIKNRTLDGRIAMSHKFLVVRYRKREERRRLKEKLKDPTPDQSAEEDRKKRWKARTEKPWRR